MRAVGVMQADPAVDPAAAVASVAGIPTYLLRCAGGAERVPSGVEVLPVPVGDRIDAARRLRAICPTGRIVILHAEESLSTELTSELREHALAVGQSYRAPMSIEIFGQRMATAPIVLAWDGDPDAVGPVIECRGSVDLRLADLQGAIAALDDRARRAATARDEVSAGDFLWRPAWGFVRRLWRRRSDGVPGFILSVLESYEEVLTAGKIWEAADSLRSRATVPPRFRRRETPDGAIVLRDDVGPDLERVLLAATPDDVEGGRLLDAGRGSTWALRTADAPPAMLRWYRRGGLPSRITRDTFIAGGVPRPLRELAVTEEARASGVPVPEVLAVRLDRVGVGRYRGAIVTREIEGGEALDQCLAGASAQRREQLLRASARVVRRMHDQGLHHRDLNASNILLVPRADEVDVYVLDLDRARFGVSVSAAERRRALRRLDRSLARVVGVDADARAIVPRTYWETG